MTRKTFFGSELESVQKALAMEEKYERTIKEGRRKIFKEHFKKYWLDGFWNVQVELKDEK